jgi:hypothetical protein
LRNNRLKFKTSGKLSINLAKSIEYTSILKKPKKNQKNHNM